ncbi:MULTISPECIES: substrate-binding domain-containing protein [unclassified Frigoribacterium]|uniref:substrate-binding domain-containing protein n=1 Tax=unclassified Frigoribacterium TaxID=2627005 RepID=UPI000700FA7D|nr:MULTISPECIES: substrate-binding domain-containing protein [unclassified Frigoribacterium]KQO48242.1 D-ribose ABC transporter substrate-binding protein [Frigoribacterium sp. Leaf254]KQT40336.1 D-ribose ABC transporter substrate-binding protein [Frigoribacterium sp. Leaf415]
MKLTSFRKAATVTAIAALVATGTAGCNRTPAGEADRPTVVLSLSTLNNPFFVELRDGATAEAKKQNVDLEIVDAQNDSATQANQLATAASTADAVILNAVDSDAAGPAAKALNEADVPIVAVDRAVNGADVASFVASDNVAGGEQAAKALAEAIGEQGEVIVLQGVAGTSASRDRGEGFTKGIAAYPNITVVAQQTANFDRATALDVTTNLLQAHPNAVGVFAENDEMGLGAIQALGSRAGTDVKVAAFDGTEDGLKAIEAGTLSSTIAQQPAELGALAVDQAVKAVNGGSGDEGPSDQAVEVITVTKENVGDFTE